MQALSQFVLPLMLLQLALGGLFRLLRPERTLAHEREKQRRKQLEQRFQKLKAAGTEAPQTAEAAPEPAAAPTAEPDAFSEPLRENNAAALRRIRLGGAVRLVLGTLGVWVTGLSVGWTGGEPPEWSDGQAPRLEVVVRNRCAPLLKQGGGPGLGVAVVSGGDQTVMGFGRAAFSRGVPDGATVFEIGSITKVFTGIALSREVERGALRLDQPAQELLPPEVRLPDRVRGRVTLQHLTTHTSGFPRLPANTLSPAFVAAMLFGGDPYASYSEAKFIDALRTVELASEPGKKFDYSNFGVSLLGYGLARQSGTSYEAYIRETVLQPLGMENTTIDLSPEQTRRFAQGYRTLLPLGPVTLGLRSAPWKLADHFAGAGALRSTPADMLKFLRANMEPDATPLKAALRRSHKQLFQESPGRGIGMNWVRSGNERLKKTVIWHNGGTGGFRSFLGFTEDGKAGVVILSNGSREVDGLAMGLLEELHAQAAEAKSR